MSSGPIFSGLRILGHMVEDVIFHQFAHQAVDGAPGGREAVKDLGALLVVIQAFENRLELADDFPGSVDQIQCFSGNV